MKVESCSYSLSLGGKTVGTQSLRTALSGRTAALEAHALWQGVFGQQQLTQSSQVNSQDGESLRFSEHTEAPGDKRSFEVVFDAKSGLVRATRRSGSQLERAETPYLRPYSDPLGLLYILRNFRGEGALRIPLLGKDVVAERLADTVVETGLGSREAHAFVLYPGPSYVYIEKSEPYAIVRLLQPTTHGLLEAYLTRLVYEEGPALTASAAKTQSKIHDKNHDKTHDKAQAAAAKPNKRRRRGGRRRKRVNPE